MRRTRFYRFGLVFTAVLQLLFPTFASVAPLPHRELTPG
jgi:hypothetical protein